MISIIIPTLNEQVAIPETLSCLLAQQASYTSELEVIIVDGGSGDGTLSVIDSYRSNFDKLIVTTTPAGRAKQLNAGAKLASGETLLFLHADTLLPDNGLEKIDAVLRDLTIAAGCFRHKFSGSQWSLSFISFLHNWRFRLTNIIYGDQAMFIRRSLFFQVGSFPEQLAEDIYFSQQLLSLTRPKMLNAYVTTDSRKFKQIGIWRALLQVIRIQLQHRRGETIKHPQFFQNYR